MHSLACADISAIVCFQKQGSIKDVSLPKSKWMGFIKDYQGATLMQCIMLFFQASRLLLKQKEIVQASICSLAKSQIIHERPQQWAKTIKPVDPRVIYATIATGWSPEMDVAAGEPLRGRHFDICKVFLDRIGNHKQAWPFLNPVDKCEVPDYYKTITSPIDLSSMKERLDQSFCTTPKLFIDGLKLIFSNYQRYNGATTIYI
jgi:histone acetyltransferase